MKLTVFHAADGDCLLLASRGRRPRHLLVDGGRKDSYGKHTRDFLGQLRDAGRKLDIVCVSHIDDDHISGILQLVEDEVEWRAFEFRRTIQPSTRAPRVLRPPVIGEVWHNGLFKLVGDDLGVVVEPVLSTVATMLAGSPRGVLREVASELDNLAHGEASSMELTRRLSDRQLQIPLNPRTGGALVKRATAGAPAAGEHITLGSMEIFLIGPSQDDIDKLRVDWKKWLEESGAALRRLQSAMIADEERLGTVTPGIVANPLIDQALGDGLSTVTAANVASIMLLVEEGPVSILLTGDGVSREILEGLKRHRKLDGAGRIHVNVLKVQHHGALANVDKAFVNSVTADHYVFCGNGAHENPEVEVVEAFALARLDGIDGGPIAGPAKPFKFWFTSGPTTPDDTRTGARRQHMTQVKEAVTRLRRRSAGRLSARFLQEGKFEIAL